MTREEFVRRWARGEAAMADDLTALLDAERANAVAELERERDEALVEVKEAAISGFDLLQRLKAVEPALERARIERGDAERARDEWKVRAEKAEAALATLKAPRFPVMTDFGGGFSIPWSVVAPFERQASLNHGGQTLERLAERGGLSPRELWHMMHGRRFSVGKPHPDCPSEADCHAWALRLATP